jgi:hypothetical protein
VLTGGRTRPRHTLRLESLLATRPARAGSHIGPEGEQVLLLCSGAPRSIAELAALLSQPVQVTKILASDLLETGALVTTQSSAADPSTDTRLLGDLLVGLRRLA